MPGKEEEGEPQRPLPLRKFRSGNVSATIWENERSSKGQTFMVQSINIDRNYYKENDKTWHTTNSMRMGDILDAIVVLQAAYEYLRLKEIDPAKEREAREQIGSQAPSKKPASKREPFEDEGY